MANQLFTNENDVFVFGKYNGEKFSSVFSSNPGYVKWAIDNKIIEISEELNHKMSNSSSNPILNIPDSNIGDIKSFIHDMISQKLLIELIGKTLEKGIELTSDKDEKTTTGSIGITPAGLQLFKGLRISFRKKLLKDTFNKINSELTNKIILLFDFISVHKNFISEDKLTYFYEELQEYEGGDFLTIEVRFNKSHLGYNSLEIDYSGSLLRDFFYFDISIPIK